MSSLRILVDVNLGIAVATSLQYSGHDVIFAGDVDWCMPDIDMLALAQRDGHIILTMDTDFGELVYHTRQPHTGVLLLRCPPATDAGCYPRGEDRNRAGNHRPLRNPAS